MDFVENSIYILNNIYSDRIEIKKENNYIIKLNGNIEEVKTRYELKKYMKKIISSDNKTIGNDIPKIINLSYILDKDKLKTLKEIFPNFDLFVSTYLKIMSEGIKLNMGIFDYESLLLKMVKTYVEYMKNKENDKLYVELNEEEKKLKNDIKTLEEKVRIYQLVKKNEFYYEAYLNSINNEKEVYEEDNSILDNTILETDKLIEQKRLELGNIESKRLSLKKQEKVNALNNELVVLTLEKQKYINEKYKIKNRNKNNIKNNDKSFEEYALMSVAEYERYLREMENVDIKELLKEINNKKQVLNKVIDELTDLKHNETKLVLKYYAVDNLKIIDRKTEMRPKVIDSIIEILEEIIKPQ